MKYFYKFGYHQFIILCGYKGEIIRDFFSRYPYNVADRIWYRVPGAADPRVRGCSYAPEKWEVELVDTGELTGTGSRLWRVRDLLKDDFWLTYGDGLGNINLREAHEWWETDNGNTVAQVTAVHPPSRFGQLDIVGDRVRNFKEKPMDASWINGGFFIISPEIFTCIHPNTMLEFTTFPTLAHEGNLGVYKHEGFWHPMDTLRDREYLEELWNTGGAPWKIW